MFKNKIYFSRVWCAIFSLVASKFLMMFVLMTCQLNLIIKFLIKWKQQPKFLSKHILLPKLKEVKKKMKKFFSKNHQVQESELNVAKTVKFKKEKSAIDSYYRLITKIFLVIGFDFDGKYQKSKLVSFGLKLIKLINMICIFLATFQCLTYFFTENLSDVGTLGSGTFGLYSVQTIVKMCILQLLTNFIN